MTEVPPVRRQDPVSVANQTDLGQKLLALRGGSSPLGGSRKELLKLVKSGSGVAMSNQAPRTSSETITNLETMLRSVPTTRRQKPPRLKVGHRAPDFSLPSSAGTTLRLSELKGRRPLAIRLTRAMGSGVI